MALYVDQAAKDDDLRRLLNYLSVQSSQPRDGAADEIEHARQLGADRAYDDAAQRLSAVLARPVMPDVPDPVQLDPDVLRMEFGPAAMCVVVVAPMGALGVERTLTFDRDSRRYMQEEPDAVDRWTRLVAAALLRDALEQLGT